MHDLPTPKSPNNTYNETFYSTSKSNKLINISRRQDNIIRNNQNCFIYEPEFAKINLIKDSRLNTSMKEVSIYNNVIESND